MGRRTAAAVASSGIILTLSASAGVAAPNVGSAPVRTANLTAAAETADDFTVSEAVTVAADAAWSFATAEVSSEAPPPPPPPEPVVVQRAERASTQTSRTSERTAAAETQSAPAPAIAEGTAAAVIDIAYRYVGTPYVHGGSTPAGFDCSGFTAYVYAQVGVSLPRSSSAQAGAGYRVSAAEARPGDLVWWPGHVGIYLGGNQHIAARQPGTPLHASQMWRSNPTFIRVL